LTVNGSSVTQSPSTGLGAIYFDRVANKFLVTENGNAYVPLVGSGASPAGPNTAIQFNNGGSFSGDASLSYAGNGAIVMGDGATTQGQIVFLDFTNTGSMGLIGYSSEQLYIYTTSNSSSNINLQAYNSNWIFGGDGSLSCPGPVILENQNYLELDDTGANSVSIAAPVSVSATYNLYLPAAQATLSGQSLVNDAAGNLSWGGIVAKIALTAQAADVPSTPLFTAVTAGMYRVTSYSVTTTADAGAGTPNVDLAWTDSSGTVQTFSFGGFNLTTVGGFFTGTYVVELAASAILSYHVAGGGTYGAATYNSYITVEQL
jgi:hypothetical protein